MSFLAGVVNVCSAGLSLHFLSQTECILTNTAPAWYWCSTTVHTNKAHLSTLQTVHAHVFSMCSQRVKGWRSCLLGKVCQIQMFFLKKADYSAVKTFIDYIILVFQDVRLSPFITHLHDVS